MRTGYISKNRGITLSIFMFSILIMLCFVGLENVDAAVIRTGVVNVGVSNVRKSPSTSSACVKHGSKNIQLKLGQTVTITNENAGWYKVNFTYSKKAYTGYVIKSNIKIKVPPFYYKAIANTNNLNVRKSSSTSSARLTYGGKPIQLKKGQNVHIYKVVSDWYYIKFTYSGKSYNGYVLGKYVTKKTYSAKTTASALYLRKGADTSYGAVASGKSYVSLKKGTNITIYGLAGNWYYIGTNYGGKLVKGYVYKSYVNSIKVISAATPKPTVKPTVTPTVKPTETPKPTTSEEPVEKPTETPKPTVTPKPTATPKPVTGSTNSTKEDDLDLTGTVASTTASGLNVRTGAGTNYSVLMSGSDKVVLPRNTLINIVSTKGDWYYVSFVFKGKALKGYVSSDYVRVMGVNAKGAYGIDVSQYQGTINWSQVKASGINYAIIRATKYASNGENGTNLVKDSKFDTNMKNAIAAGIKVGVYVYSYGDTKAEVVNEAELVMSYVKPYKLTYPIYFDIEEASRQKASLKTENTNFAIAFCEKVQAGGYKAGVYTGATFFNSYLSVDALNDYDLWIARYIYTTSYKLPTNKELLNAYVNKTYMYNTSTGAKDKFNDVVADMWQFSSTCKVNGISGQIDMNYTYKAY
ncbi:MAG: hypothetical protein E7262_06625 [Lachnospiraceae bacterium]|nr:hypothetical protein [Lachnospiraceae bacterium]